MERSSEGLELAELMCPQVKRGVAAGRSAQRACERSSDWRRGAAGSPSYPDSFWRSAFCPSSGRAQLENGTRRADFAPVCVSSAAAKSAGSPTNEPAQASERGKLGQKARLRRLRLASWRVFEKLSG